MAIQSWSAGRLPPLGCGVRPVVVWEIRLLTVQALRESPPSMPLHRPRRASRLV
jgi:hypothetical protein